MKYIIKFPTLDDLCIGPFDTWELANRFAHVSVFLKHGHRFEIYTLVTPRPDHTNGKYKIVLPEAQ